MNNKEIHFQLTKNEAIVLFEFLSRFSESDELKIEDPSEEKVLWSLCNTLESVLVEPLKSDWTEILSKARKALK